MKIDVAQMLQQGRDSFGRRGWDEAFTTLARIGEAGPLAADDLERAATAAYLTGRDEDYLKLLERAHHAHQDAGDCERAARCAFWLGLWFVFRGETGPATGWFGRARRLIEQHERACVEQGYLLLPLVEQHLMSGKPAAAYEAAADALAIGSRFRDADLVAIALHLQGRALLREREVERGLALLDEAMVAVTADELSPIVTGLIYCSVIDACQQVCAFGRAGEWTAALARWCADQTQLVAFTDRCLVHRSEIMQLRGAWDDAIAEARRACLKLEQRAERRVATAAYYQQGEIHRLRGDFESAETAYRNVSHWGGEPQPGLALLRLAQGRIDAAAAAIRRSVGATADPFQRVRLLPAHVEIMLAAHDPAEAHAACQELEELARAYGTDVLRALAAHARGTVDLADGKHREALNLLQAARRDWQELDVPYLAARVRVESALACRALGDDEGAAMELDVARAVFERLGAVSDVVRVDTLARGRSAVPSHGLTARELQVLRILASGKTNKAIARELALSEKTVDRHISNIFNKLDVPSRAAATGYAYAHRLIEGDG